MEYNFLKIILYQKDFPFQFFFENAKDVGDCIAKIWKGYLKLTPACFIIISVQYILNCLQKY